jgi:condensation domain-containing protein/phthiocerol/phthiodiolone dimycocerosyl transferase-like enzyme
MTISASETLIRYLGPSETYFWLSNQNSWKHFVVAAQITGGTTTASWRTALDAVQQRHPLLGFCIDADDSGAPYFRLLPELRIPLQIVPGNALQGWQDEMATELSTPFPVEDALLVRAVLLHEAHRATILLTMHHSIADGLSVALIVRDILEALSGKPLEALPIPQPQEALCPPPTIQSTELGSEKRKAPAPPNAPGNLLKRDRSLLRVRGIRLSAELSDRLRERSRREGTTVHGALVAALVLAGRDIHREWRQAPVRVVSPVNNRAILGRGDDCALSIIFPAGSYDPKSPNQFWEVARSVRDDLADMRTSGGLSAVFGGFDQLISSKPGVQGIAQFELQVCACEMMVSNLGILPFEGDFGGLRLEAFWGPSVFVGIEREQMIGAATLRGTIHLLHSSYTPIASLLETTEQTLRAAVS